MPSVDALLEAEKRGILPEDKKPLLAEARKRGLVPADSGHKFDAAQQTAYDDEAASIKRMGQDNTFSAIPRRATHAATFGASDEILAGAAAAVKAPYNLVTGGPGLRDSFNQEWARQQAHLDNAREHTDGIGLGIDVIGGFAGIGPRALVSGAQLAAPTVLETLKSGAKVGTAAGGAVAFNEAEGSVLDRLQFVPEGMAAGLVTGSALAGGLRGVGAARQKYVERKQARAEARGELPNARAAEFDEAGVPVFTPALTDSPIVQSAARALQGTIAGGSIRASADRSISALEQSIMDTIRANGGAQTTAEAGEATQAFLRRNLVDRSTPAEDVKRMSPEQLQDVSSVPPGPLYQPVPQKVAPVAPRHVEPVTPDEYLETVRASVEPVQPIEVRQVAPRLPYVNRDKVAAAEGAQQKLNDLKIQLDGVRREQSNILDDRLFQARAAVEAEPFFKSATAQQWAPFLDGTLKGGPVTAEWEAQFAQFAQAIGNPREAKRLIGIAARAAEAAEAKSAAVLRERDLLSAVEQQGLVVERSRDTAYQRAIAEDTKVAAREADDATRAAAQQEKTRAATETERLRQEAVDRARPTAEAQAGQRTRDAKVLARQEAEKETARLQEEQNRIFEADQVKRKEAAGRPIEIGRSSESYPTEFDAAFEQNFRNAPTGNIGNALGNRDDPPLLTNVARLINDMALEARGTNANLRGYKSGQLFGADGEGPLDKRVAEHLRDLIGDEATDRIVYLAELRSKKQASPGIRSYHQIRTATGRDMADAGARRPDGETRRGSEAALARLYKAIDADMGDMALAGGGDIYRAQRQQIDAQYSTFLNDIRQPLSRVFGDSVTPEQAMERLISAAGTKKGDSQLLRAFYKVVDDKGDRLLATNAILHRMSEGGLEGFLKTYRAISPDAKNIMFHGSASEYGRTLDKMARVGGYLEGYAASARGDVGLNIRTAGNPGNIAAAGLAYFINLPMAISSVLGAEVTARLLSSQRFAQWLRGAGDAAVRGGEAWRRHATRVSGVAQSAIGMDPTTADALSGAIVSMDNQGQQHGNVAGMEKNR